MGSGFASPTAKAMGHPCDTGGTPVVLDYVASAPRGGRWSVKRAGHLIPARRDHGGRPLRETQCTLNFGQS